MIRTSFILLLSFYSLCSVGQQTYTDTIWHDGIAREFIVYVPAVYSGIDAVPLVLNFHGLDDPLSIIVMNGFDK